MQGMGRRDDVTIAQLRKGVLEFCVLALLQDQERYSFEIVRALGDTEALVTSEGTVYPLLARLRRDGLLVSRWQESHTGPPRRYYRITPKGRAALRGFTAQWTRFRGSVDAILDTGAVV